MFKINPNDNTMTLTKSNSAEFIISPTVTDPNDEKKTVPYILQEGERIIFTIKSRYSDVKLIEKIFTNADYNGNGGINVVLTCQDTAVLDVNSYIYDVAFQPVGVEKFETFIGLAEFKVVRQVSELITDE